MSRKAALVLCGFFLLAGVSFPAVYAQEGTRQPAVSILYPLNNSFFDVSLGGAHYQLIYGTNSSLSWVGYSVGGKGYSIDGKGSGNVTVSGNGTWVHDFGSSGYHTLTLYANDTSGNWATPQTVTYLVNFYPDYPPSPSPTAEPNDGRFSLAPGRQFFVPSTNGSISFAIDGSYQNATLEDNIWTFKGLNLAGSASLFPSGQGSILLASAQNSNVTITKFNPLNVFPPMGSGTLEYTVAGVGTQEFKVYYYPNWLSYAVEIDSDARSEDYGWNVTDNGFIIIAGANSQVKVVWTPVDPMVFGSDDRFDIPGLNSSVSFEGTGTYIFANLENATTWRFQNLALNGAKPQGAPHWALGMSAQNCKVAITGYLAPFGTTGKGWLNYTVSGLGTQTFNGDLDEEANFPLNHTVYIDGEKAPNGSWTVSADGWITVHGAALSVGVYSEPIIPDWFWDLPAPGATPNVQVSPSSTAQDSSISTSFQTPDPLQKQGNVLPIVLTTFAVITSTTAGLLYFWKCRRQR